MMSSKAFLLLALLAALLSLEVAARDLAKTSHDQKNNGVVAKEIAGHGLDYAKHRDDHGGYGGHEGHGGYGGGRGGYGSGGGGGGGGGGYRGHCAFGCCRSDHHGRGCLRCCSYQDEALDAETTLADPHN